MRKLHLLAFVFIFAFCSTLTSRAQTQNISFDSVIFDVTNIGIFGGGQMNLANSNTSVFSLLRDGYLGAADSNKFGGQTLSLLSHYSGDLSLRGGYPGTINGNLYEKIYFSGSLRFDGGNYKLPTRYSRRRFTVTLPATLTGSLNGYAEPVFNSSPAPLFTSQLNLRGTVSVTLQVVSISIDPNGTSLTPLPYYRIHRIKYNFPNAAANFTE